MPIRLFQFLSILTLLALGAGPAAAGDSREIYGFGHEITSPRDVATTKQLDMALRRFEREIAGKRGRSAARSSKPKEIVVVGSKVKDVVRSAGAPSGGFSDVSGLNIEIDPVEYRSGGPASLPQLQAAIRRFEQASGASSSCVKSCETSARRCLARCRGTLRRNGIKGRCICAHIQARCLLRSAGDAKCYPPDPGRAGRRIKRLNGR